MPTKNIPRREFLKTGGAAVAGLTVAAHTQAAEAGTDSSTNRSRPNVLMLMTDMQWLGSISAYGCDLIDTPNMDRIAREGAIFNDANCVTPYCSPSRATMLTGVYPHRHGVLKNIKETPDCLPGTVNTETVLHSHGYQTAHRGKWHLGDKGDFDCYETWGYSTQNGREYKELLDRELPLSQFKDFDAPERAKYQGRPVDVIPVIEQGIREMFARKIGVPYISVIGRSVIPPELLPETIITDEICAKLDEFAGPDAKSDAPFMITGSWSPPHDLWVVPEPYYSMVDRAAIELPGVLDVPEWDRRGPSKVLGDIIGEEGIREYVAIYLGMVKYIDDQLGRVLDKLDEIGQANNTIVLFTSDHGDMMGSHGIVGKSVFSCYDRLVRIPLAMRYPGHITPGTIIDEPVSQVDFMPTLLDYTGFSSQVPDDIHGLSMRGLLSGVTPDGAPEEPWRDHVFCQRANNARMLVADGYKYTFDLQRRQATLYNIEIDRIEDHNLAGDPGHARALAHMHGRLRDVMQTDGDAMVAMM